MVATDSGAIGFTSGVRDAFLTDHGQYIVTRNGLAVLVGDFGVPADLPETLVGARRLLLAGETDLDAVAGFDRLGESQPIYTVVGQYRAVRGIHEQTGGSGNEEITVSNAPAEQGIAACRLFVHVSVEFVAGQLRKALDIG